MRTLLTAALAVLALAAPATAQPDAGVLMRQAMERLVANEGPDVRDYSLTLVHPGGRSPVYVARQENGWAMHMREDEGFLGDFVGMAVFWPEFSSSAASPDNADALEAAAYVREETVEGRRAHVLALGRAPHMQAQGLDSALLYVDARTRQLVRVSVIAPVPGGLEAFGEDARMSITIDAAGHRETDGLTIPRSIRVRMRPNGPAVDQGALQEMRDQAAASIAEFEGSSLPEAAEMTAVLRMFAQLLSEEGMDLRITVEDVRVNPGPPEWLDDSDF